MSTPALFALTPDQQQRLLACRAAGEEGEDEERLERLRQREEDTETLRAFARQLADVDFAQGGSLTRAQMAHLLTLVRLLAPNPNLDARLLRRPGEPESFNHDLRDLLYGAEPIAQRLRQFLTRRHAGGQTALQLLCAAFPAEWPLITQPGLRALELSPEQRQAARMEARRRFSLPEEVHGIEGSTLSPVHLGVPDIDPVLRLLGDVIVYEAARDLLEAPDFVAVHRLLTGDLAGRPQLSRRARLMLHYPPPSTFSQQPAISHQPPTTTTPRPPTPDPRHPSQSVRAPERPDYQAGPVAPSADLAPPPDIAGLAHTDLLAEIEQEVAAQGFTYPPLILRDYYISLQTKPFVLLSGLSGTGKTRLTALFAAALTGDLSAQYLLLPVRPDWADSAPLLGYMNLLASGGEGRFVSTPFLEFLRRAARPENGYRAYFICLDEMNLARVEHYFAELLSAMETPERELLLPSGQPIRLPANLFLSGTLNLDESTYTLSRKVLDRANTLVFQEVELRAEEGPGEAVQSERPAMPPFAARQTLFLQARVTTVAAARARLNRIEAGSAARIVDRLAEANALLEPHGLHFAYRIRDEILRYCANSFDVDGRGLLAPDAPEDHQANLQIALDLQLLQKVAPRLSGTQEQIEAPLRALLRWAETQRFARTARRLQRLLTRLQRDGFVSFEEG